MTRFKELRRFDAALEGEQVAEVEWALTFATSMLSRMKLKAGVDEWRKRKQRAEYKLQLLQGRSKT